MEPHITAALFCRESGSEIASPDADRAPRGDYIEGIAGKGFHRPGVRSIDEPMPPYTLTLSVAIFMWPGDARGRVLLRTRWEGPGGWRAPGPAHSVVFDDGVGIRFTLVLQVTFEQPGFHSLVCEIDSREVIRSPLVVVYDPHLE